MIGRDEKGRRILIVEDDGIISARLESILTKYGYNVLGVVAYGEEVFPRVSETLPELLLMDIYLAGDMNGLEAAALVRESYDIPIIYLTAYSDESLLKEAGNTEFYGYLVKPVQDRDIRAAIDTAFEKHRLETELKDNERMLDTTLGSIGDAVITTDSEARVTFMNHVAEKYTGWRQIRALGKPLPRVFRTRLHDSGESIEKRALRVLGGRKGGSLSKSSEIINRKGVAIPIDESLSPIQDDKGNATGVVLVFRDVSERVRAEKKQEQLVRALNDRITELNCLFGISKIVERPELSLDEILQGAVDIIPTSMKSPESTCARVIIEGRTVARTVGFKEAKWGLKSPILIHGEHVGLLEVYFTKKIPEKGSVPFEEKEKNLIESIAVRLGQIIEHRWLDNELIKAGELESVGILIGGIAHDFNNIIAIIMNNISLAMDCEKKSKPLLNLLMEARRASHKARELTGQLITCSQGCGEKKRIIHMDELLKKTARFSLAGSSSNCEFIMEKGLWPVMIDERRITHVFINIFINAVHAMPEGGVIRVYGKNINNSSHGEEEDYSLKKGKYVKISVQDQGMGISRKHLSRIFDPFFSTRARKPRKEGARGLSTSYSIIKKHNGDIRVESRPGKGSTIHICLPATKSESPGKVFKVDFSDKCKGNILVMDDDEMIRNMTGMVLAHFGYDVAFANDGDQAIQLYKTAMNSENPYDAVILDLTVRGGMGGKEAILKLVKIDPQVKGIVTSGYFNNRVMTDYKKYGFCGVLPKPSDQFEILEIIKKVTR